MEKLIIHDGILSEALHDHTTRAIPIDRIRLDVKITMGRLCG